MKLPVTLRLNVCHSKSCKNHDTQTPPIASDPATEIDQQKQTKKTKQEQQQQILGFLYNLST